MSGDGPGTRRVCPQIYSTGGESITGGEEDSVLFICIYIFIYACVHVPPPPPLRLFSSLVHKIENNLTFSWLKATQTINLLPHFPLPPLLSLHIHRR